jgi:hypothetical protein
MKHSYVGKNRKFKITSVHSLEIDSVIPVKKEPWIHSATMKWQAKKRMRESTGQGGTGIRIPDRTRLVSPGKSAEKNFWTLLQLGPKTLI